MTVSEKIDIKREVNKIKYENIEESMLMFYYFIKLYLTSIVTVGFNSKISNEVLLAYNEFKEILNRERYLFELMIYRYRDVNYDDAIILLNDLDELNEKTVKYYYDVFDILEDAVYLKEEYRLKRNKKDFDTLIETDEYVKRLQKKY